MSKESSRNWLEEKLAAVLRLGTKPLSEVVTKQPNLLNNANRVKFKKVTPAKSSNN